LEIKIANPFHASSSLEKEQINWIQVQHENPEKLFFKKNCSHTLYIEALKILSETACLLFAFSVDNFVFIEP